ncbi:hypothetical protein MKX03_027194 [Papaver bracteatum]|nr:hypothetical protein MKX03_027194 [Papaver bracteatum]
MWESALVTGLSFMGSDVIHPRGCAGSELINKYFLGKKSITLGELSRKFDFVEQSTDKVKLGLVLLVQGVLMGNEYVKDVNLAYFHMVENIEKFKKFPWGKLCHQRMLKCFRNVVGGKKEEEQIGNSRTNPKGKSAIAGHGSFRSAYNLYGFPYAFQVWAFEIIPLLRKSFAIRLKPKQFPRVLQYACDSIRPESSAVENILTSKIEVLACIKPVEGEMSSKHMRSVLLMSADLSELEDDDKDKAVEMETSMEMQSANEDWEVAKDDGSETQAPQSCSNQDTQLLREVFTQVKELTSKVSRMDKEMSKLKDGDNRNNQASIEMREILEMALRVAAEKKRIKQDHPKEKTELEKDMARDKLELEFEEKEVIEKLEKKERQHEYLEDLNQILIAKERKSNDELQEARNELTRELREMSSRASIGVKRMGELEMKPFYDICKRKYCSDEAYVKAVEICTSWEACLRDPHWHPFKIIEVGNNHQETINEDDEKLRGLRNEFGEEVYRAVTTAIMEMNEYNASGRFVVSELWNFREGRKASLKEVVSHLLKQVKTLKRKRTS